MLFRFQVIIMFAFLLPGIINAELYFYEYLDQVSGISQSNRQWLGDVTLERSEIRITSHGSYLDIVEDAWISGNISSGINYSYMYTGIYCIDGTLNLPSRTVLTGLLVWDGDKVCKAKLYPPGGNLQTTDQTTPESFMNEINSNIGVIEKTGPSKYKVTLQKTGKGEAKHIRVRYLMANTGVGKIDYKIPVLFCTNYFNPERIKLSFGIIPDGQTFNMYNKDIQFQLTSNSVNYIQFNSTIHLTSHSPVASIMHVTKFADGDWQGDYLHFNTVLPDTVAGLLSQPVQTVFIWRWNAPQSFVEYQNNTRYISWWGYQALDQANRMSYVIGALCNQGHSAGLVHSIEGKTPVSFPMSTKNSANLSRINEYLHNVNETYILQNYGSKQTSKPDWAPKQIKNYNEKSNGKDEFLKSISIARGLYVNETGIMRHVIFLSAGPSMSSTEKITTTQLDSLCNDLTIDISNVEWSGVEFTPSTSTRTVHSNYLGFNFPDFRPHSVSVTISNTLQKLTFPLSNLESSSFSCIAKTTSQWDSIITWSGFNAIGQKLKSVDIRCEKILNSPFDTGLVKLWAGDENRLSEKYESNLGFAYGIVTKEYSLHAGINDTILDNQNSIAYLTEDEIIPPIAVQKTVQDVMNQKFTWKYVSGFLTIQTCADDEFDVLEIYNALGKLLVSINLKETHLRNTFKVRLSDYRNLQGAKMLVVCVRGKKMNKTFTLVTGGHV